MSDDDEALVVHSSLSRHRGDGPADDVMTPGGGSGGAAGRGDGAEWASWSAQIQELTQRNAQLLDAVDARDERIAELETALIANEPIVGAAAGGADADPRDAKVIELSKRNRSLNLALQKYKDRCAGVVVVSVLVCVRVCFVWVRVLQTRRRHDVRRCGVLWCDVTNDAVPAGQRS
jgi:hypothetical protein